MKHLMQNNLTLITTRILSSTEYSHAFLSKEIVDKCTISNRGKETNYVFPLYIYQDIITEQDSFDNSSLCRPNFDREIVTQIEKSLGLALDWTAGVGVSHFDSNPPRQPTVATPQEGNSEHKSFTATDLLDYIYAVLHSPEYRLKYKEFLKIDFPRITMPNDKIEFWRLVGFGGELRKIHLLESPIVEQYITQYPIDGNNIVDKIKFESNSDNISGKVHINETQYFDNVPNLAWNFYIGGYQPAQKWLKDRKGRELSFEDILHYQKIIVALNKTNTVMNQIDLV
jgi:predicted helicase